MTTAAPGRLCLASQSATDLLSLTPHGSALVARIDLPTIDDAYSSLVETALLDAAERSSGCVVVDLAQVVECSSAGLRALLAAAERCRELGGQLALARGHASLWRLLSTTGLNEQLPCFDSVDTAAEACSMSGLPRCF